MMKQEKAAPTAPEMFKKSVKFGTVRATHVTVIMIIALERYFLR